MFKSQLKLSSNSALVTLASVLITVLATTHAEQAFITFIINFLINFIIIYITIIIIIIIILLINQKGRMMPRVGDVMFLDRSWDPI